MSAKPPKPPPTVRARTTNFLLYGFVLSILLHLIIGPFVKFERTQEAPEKTDVVKIDKMPTPPPTPKPTPPPTPTPPPKNTPPPSTPQPKPPQAIKINTLKTTSHNGEASEEGNTHTTGSENGAPQGTGNAPATAAPVVATPAPPTPSPTPTPPTCAVPNADARTISAAQPDTPAIAQQQGITGDVYVLVTLDENSKLVAEKVTKSPSSLLNAAALAAARQSTFKTRIVDCKPVADSYNFIVEFASQ
jgi:outer membrane biosynthesis protein TonB